MDKVVRVIGAKNPVMDQRMGLEGLIERADRPVHHEAMQGPLEERGVYDGGNAAHRHPEEIVSHVQSQYEILPAESG